ETGDVAARSREARDKAAANRIGNRRENDRDGARLLKQYGRGGGGIRKDEVGPRRVLSRIVASNPRRRAWPSECQSERRGHPAPRACEVRPGMPRYNPVLASRSRESPSTRRLAALYRAAAPAPRAAMLPRR